MTITVSITEYRNRTDEILDAVIEGEETVIVTLADDRNFVLVPGPEWRSMDETAYLTSTAANRAALLQSLKEAEEGRIVEVEL
ncbi:MAG: type II toxin-antitoxin system Phd/YefM family antitoxin [Gammaproteobacteria bacterium]